MAVRYDSFRAVQGKPGRAVGSVVVPNGPFDVVLNHSGRVLRVPADKSLLKVLEEQRNRHQVTVQRRLCGTCKVGRPGGIAGHRDDCLDDDQKDTAIQVCVSRAAPGQTLVLDI